MIKEIKKLLESLFDDDDDELFNDDNIGMTNDLLEDDARKIREQLLKGIVVSDDDLELVCQDAFKYKVKDFNELVHIIADIKQQLYKDKVDAFNLNWLDISNVTMLDQLFNVGTFNRQYIFWDVSDWDTSHVTSMVGTFNGCKDICDLSKWDTSKVTSMVNMFYGCSTFNGNISNWNVSKVTRFDSMFYGCSSFNQDISNWDISSAENLSYMFYNCIKFNQPIQKWNITKNMDISYLLYGCTSFDQDLSLIDLRSFQTGYFDLYDTGTKTQKEHKSARVLNEWDFLKLGFDRSTEQFDVGEFEYGDGGDNHYYPKIYTVNIDIDAINHLTDDDYFMDLEDIITLEGQDPDTYQNEDLLTIDVLTYSEFELLYDICSEVSDDNVNKGDGFPPMKILIKNKVVNDLYDIKEIVDNTNIEYYIKRELLSLDIKYEEFNSYTGWNINEFKEFLLNINNEINKIKQN
ncbi:MAG: hypothetical protein [phage Lak_Megaphage_RVC_AP4_GC26]|uniref:BspA family leucine-rich repeat surface protein n=1 Tax=phage Lak_Megaphage_RVC_AP3_GC26 TaxID=3109225 RepID=A0ABZ0YZW2_9CAUD|nr:MAG: hypothetical protein [phage Lak_Megaphage_RVC_AP3_GC26]WQJ52289.1 MAG: hypothetical protein [phage Lak_Megaphage_RVC_AP4_GC26]